jgi:hypothetical protein
MDALLALKKGLIGNDNTKLADWGSNNEPCPVGAWTGITCVGNDVTKIDLCKWHLLLFARHYHAPKQFSTTKPTNDVLGLSLWYTADDSDLGGTISPLIGCPALASTLIGLAFRKLHVEKCAWSCS